jgi:hypothetical protein
MNTARDQRGSVGDNDRFVTMILAAREDATMKAALESILALPPALRKSFITTLTADMKRNRAPADFIEAIAYLQDDEVARKVCEALKL